MQLNSRYHRIYPCNWFSFSPGPTVSLKIILHRDENFWPSTHSTAHSTDLFYIHVLIPETLKLNLWEKPPGFFIRCRVLSESPLYLHRSFCSLSPLTLNCETPSMNSAERDLKKFIVQIFFIYSCSGRSSDHTLSSLFTNSVSRVWSKPSTFRITRYRKVYLMIFLPL